MKAAASGNHRGGAREPSLFEHLITHYRWVFCIFFLMPLSVAFDLFLFCRSLWSSFQRRRAPAQHSERVRRVSQAVKRWADDGAKGKMCSARPAWMSMSLRMGKYKKTYRNIPLDLHDVLEVNTAQRRVRVEPMVSMGQLTSVLNPLGWTLPVVPELDDLTVGGLISGVGVETSSHKYGLFQHICKSIEIVIADGSVQTCSASQNPDLFYNIPWAHGTLGFVVAVELSIIPCEKYVKLQYIPFREKEPALEAFAAASRSKTADFVEMLAFSPNDYVLMLGDMISEAEVTGSAQERARINRIGDWHKPWFYTHVRGLLAHTSTATSSAPSGPDAGSSVPASAASSHYYEHVPLRHYYHRHTKSLFWEVEDIIPFGNHVLFRFLFGWMMPPKPSLLKLTQTEELRRLYEEHHVVQDMLVPIESLGRALTVFDQEWFIYPLWLCPFRIFGRDAYEKYGGFLRPFPRADREDDAPSPPPGHGSEDDGDVFVDIGGYGNPTVPGFNARDSVRRVEEFVRNEHGYQMMYADSYMTREEFRAMFDHTAYDRLRDRIAFCKDAFPEVYDKVCKAARI